MLNVVKTTKYQNVTKSRKIAAFCFQCVNAPHPLRCPHGFAPLIRILHLCDRGKPSTH